MDPSVSDNYNFILSPRVSLLTQDGRIYLFDPVSRTYASMNKKMLSFLSKPGVENAFAGSSVKTRKDLAGIIEHLCSSGILIEKDTEKGNTFIESGKSFSMPHLTIFVTTKCNLRCVYCYANGGDSGVTITRDIWMPAMEYFFSILEKKIASGQVRENAGLSIHGGGEPTLEFQVLKEIVAVFRAKCTEMGLQPVIGMGTNGTYSKSVHKWIIENNINVNISLDGPPDVHNRLRPFRSGKPSFERVVENLKELVMTGRHVAVRATVTKDTVDSMEETVELCNQIGLAAVHFEPLALTGRCLSSKADRPEADQFAASFLKSFLTGLKHDVDVTYSGLRCFDRCRQLFCGACGENFCITPAGDITTCYEVLVAEDPAACEFFIGRVKEGNVELDRNRIEQLNHRNSEKMKACAKCFLRYQCAGGCPVKSYRYSGRNIYSPDPYSCRIAQIINKQLIAWLADGIIDPRTQQQKVFCL